jgi:hypothetical protein
LIPVNPEDCDTSIIAIRRRNSGFDCGELAGGRVRYGYRRLTVMLWREGWEVIAKRICRLYTEEGLIVRTYN